LKHLLLERLAPQVAAEAEALKAALSATDDESLPLQRFHLLAEQMLERIIAGHLKRADRLLGQGRLSFAQKLHLVHSFDLIEDASVTAMQRVNTLRNDCAHVHGKQLAISDIDRIGQPLGKDYSEMKRTQGHSFRGLLAFTLARVAQPFIATLLAPDAEAHLRAELNARGREQPAK
jgi:hypothetical protein